MSEDNGGQLTAPTSADGQLDLWGEMLAVERERIASRDRAVDAMREGFLKLDAADERQYRYHTDRLQRDDKFRNRRLTHVIQLTWVGAGVGIILLSLLVFLLFWGNEDQRAMAVQLITHGLASGGFLAVGFFLGRRSRS